MPCCNPLTICGSKITFFILFGLCYFLETISFTYLISAIQSIERQFQIPSKLSGILVAANDAGYLLTVVFLAYAGGRGNRARWIGAGCLIISLACLLISSPHYIFPHKELKLNDSVINRIFLPPDDLKREDVNPELLLNYTPVRKKIIEKSPLLYEKLLNDIRGTEDNSFKDAFYDMFGFASEEEYAEMEEDIIQTTTTTTTTTETLTTNGPIINMGDVDRIGDRIVDLFEDDATRTFEVPEPTEEVDVGSGDRKYPDMEDEDVLEPNNRAKRSERSSSALGFGGAMSFAYHSVAKLTRIKRSESEMQEVAMKYLIGEANAKDVLKMIQAKINATTSIPSKHMERMHRAAGLPFGFCDKRINGLKIALREIKCKIAGTNWAAYTIVFIGIMLIGAGHSLPFALGLPLIDDNVRKQNTPLYFAGMFFIRILGPVLGFLVGAMCMRQYFTLKKVPGLTPLDPRWIGAWWLGYLIIALLLFIPALLLFCFAGIVNVKPDPKNLDVNAKMKKKQLSLVDKHKIKKTKDGCLPAVKDFLVSVWAVLKSPVYVGALFGRCFDAFAFKGFFTFLPKFIATHYGISQAQVYILMAIMGVLGFAAGVVIGSLCMRKFKLEGRKAAIWVSIGSLIAMTISFSMLSLGCTSRINKIGLSGSTNGFNFDNSCNLDCECGPAGVYPVCSSSGKVYFSPCHAGCLNMTLIDKTTMKFAFKQCKCIDEGTEVSTEYCNDDCKKPLILYFLLMTISGAFAGSTVIPGVLIVLRSVPPHLRSISLGFSGFFVALVSLLPSPIVYGAVIDGTCLLWNDECSTGQGSCLIYHPAKLLFRMHMLNGCLRLVTVLADGWVIYFSKGLKLMEEDPEPDYNVGGGHPGLYRDTPDGDSIIPQLAHHEHRQNGAQDV